MPNPQKASATTFNEIGVTAQMIKLRLRSPDVGATFSLQKGVASSTTATTGAIIGARGAVAMTAGVGATTSEQYDRVCTAPCEVELMAGTRKWKLELPNGDAAATDNVLTQGDATLTATYNSRSGLRAVLGVASLAALVGGLAVIFTSSGSSSRVYAGLGITISSGLFWGIMDSVHDVIDVAVVPN
jgi:hypothetical protein